MSHISLLQYVLYTFLGNILMLSQVRYLLHTHREWKGDDKDGSHSTFFGQITKFLNGEKEELTSGECDADGLQSNVLAWYNKYVICSCEERPLIESFSERSMAVYMVAVAYFRHLAPSDNQLWCPSLV